MNLEKYTDRARGFVQSAQSLALREGHQQFAPEHLLKVLLDDPEGLAAGLIDRSGGRSREALSAVEAALAKRPKVEGGGAGQLYLEPALARGFDTAEKSGEKAGDSFVTVERLLVALAVEKDNEAGKILSRAGVTPQNLNAAINALRKGRTADSAKAEQAYDALKRCGQSRRRDGCVQSAQPSPGARRAALHRGDDARRIQEACREGRGARAALPAGVRVRADSGRHGVDPARPEGQIRAASWRAHQR